MIKLRNKQQNYPGLVNYGDVKHFSELISRKKILLAHQSVGRDILQGILELAPSLNELDIGKFSNADTFEKSALYHFNIGKNRYPNTKLDEFLCFLNNGPGHLLDIACLKFCYVDIFYTSDIDALFESYVDTFNKIRAQFPKLVIIHITVPLTESKLKLVDHIASLLGSTPKSALNNQKRNEFNTLLLREYFDVEPIFDLAKIQSTNPDGTRSSFINKDDKILQLSRDYSSDGGHLNQTGRIWVAYNFLKTLYMALNAIKSTTSKLK